MKEQRTHREIVHYLKDNGRLLCGTAGYASRMGTRNPAQVTCKKCAAKMKKSQGR